MGPNNEQSPRKGAAQLAAEALCRPLRGLERFFCAMSHGLTPVATFWRALRALNGHIDPETHAALSIPYVVAS